MVKMKTLQEKVLSELIKNKLHANIFTTNGFQIMRAAVVAYDNFVVLIETDGKQMMVYKHAISSIVILGNINTNDVISGD